MVDFGVGITCTIVAAILYGLQYIPCKQYCTYDGAVFQWFMCSGIIWGGIVLEIVGMLSGQWEGPQIFLYGVLSGALWGTANFIVIPLVRICGLALGFSLYHIINLSWGYCLSRFGLFGMDRDVGRIPVMRDVGVFVLLFSFAILFFVDPDEATDADSKSDSSGKEKRKYRPSQSRRLRKKQQQQGGQGQTDQSGTGGVTSEPSRGAAGTGKTTGPSVDLENGQSDCRYGEDSHGKPSKLWIKLERFFNGDDSSHAEDDEPDAKKAHQQQVIRVKIVGMVLAVVSGVLTAMNGWPYQLWQQKYGYYQPVQFVFSQCIGIYFISSVWYWVASLFRQFALKKRTMHSVIRPAFIAGLFWTGGDVNALYGIDGMGYAAAYTLDAVGPVMISSLLSIFVYREIKEKKQRIIFALAFCLQLAGCLLVAIGE
ncbi:hypothetical protein FOZ60_003503 [Perkinsus olseni]|uniref:Uncharacterized protein n=2 Tax=Perkinsus olseni TaxID=32597 RepID=A0A7J6NW37_PEROL|nr:hypothetical protein FOZ60_003503 [Perkinsus olseni]